jgi:predicted TIM-barrel fold metal-dependent hydrolase
MFHASGSDYGERYGGDWGHFQTNTHRAHATPFANLMYGDRPTIDTTIAIFHDRLFERFPNVRIAYVELGSDWVSYVLKKLEKSADHHPRFFKERPLETFRQHCYVSPFYEEDLRALADLIGVNRVVFGSDWPHPEGLYEPAAFANDLKGFTPDEQKIVMRDAAMELLTPRPASHA